MAGVGMLIELAYLNLLWINSRHCEEGGFLDKAISDTICRLLRSLKNARSQ
jgi:hypothetical protein